jgi:alginate O-acetyltransferase complex protein AlgI
MLFNSLEYFIFLPIVFMLYWFLFSKRVNNQNILILIASYCFYGWWSWKFLILLGASTLMNYLYGYGVSSENKRKANIFLWIAVITNLGILGLFKYYNFFVSQFQKVGSEIGIHINPILLEIGLPVGISFYTFHGMSYLFDVHKGSRKPVNKIIEYAVFICFFPLLVSGPIERSNHLLPQIKTKRIFNYSQAVEGCRLILWGMFKKVVIADSIAFYVDDIFNNYSSHNSLTLILGVIGFSIQIYGDFSGYTDIAIGTAKLFGFELLSNFKFPYFSRDVAEFWRRWHISLTSWFRDYLYIPLGGSKKGKIINIKNVLIIFLISGFWHGAGWNFIIWGAINACGYFPLLILNTNRTYAKEIVAVNRTLPTIKELLQMLSTFGFISFSRIFFRNRSVNEAINYIKGIFTNFQFPGEFLLYTNMFIYIIPLIIIDWFLRRDERKLRMIESPLIRYSTYITFSILIISLMIIRSGSNKNFIYFQF